jgi:hypothetical protein
MRGKSPGSSSVLKLSQGKRCTYCTTVTSIQVSVSRSRLLSDMELIHNWSQVQVKCLTVTHKDGAQSNELVCTRKIFQVPPFAL